MESMYWVQLWPNGKWDGERYHRVYAETPKHAAEQMTGIPLDDVGNLDQIRAQVRVAGRSSGIVFYERT